MTISKTQETNDKRNGILSSHELNEVIRSYKNADAAGDTYERDRLFVIILDSNRKLIYKVMQSRYPSFIRAYGEDMMQFCATELFKILPNYDAEKGVFSTYFTPSIIHACQQFVNELNGYTAHYGAQIYKIKKYLAKAETLNWPTSAFDIADATKIPIHTVEKCLEILNAQEVLPFDPTSDAIVQARGFDRSPEEETIEREEKAVLMKSIDTLSPEVRRIIKLKYGFGCGGQTMTDTAIAEMTGMNKQTVRRVISNAQNQLHNILKKNALFSERTIYREIEELSKNVVFVPKVSEEDAIEADMFMQMNKTVF